MRKIIFPLIAVGAALWITGCAGPEEKLGRGLSNTAEVVRLGEMRRTIECESVLRSPDEGYTTGVIRGFNRSLERTGLGLYEVITFPIPNHEHGSYEPVATKYFAPNPVYPESYKPGLVSDPLFDTDTFTGFSGGDIAPWVPGSRFKVFDN